MIASTKCYQLSQAFQSIATKISYEEALTVTTYLVQCAINALSVRIYNNRRMRIYSFIFHRL